MSNASGAMLVLLLSCAAFAHANIDADYQYTADHLRYANQNSFEHEPLDIFRTEDEDEWSFSFLISILVCLLSISAVAVVFIIKSLPKKEEEVSQTEPALEMNPVLQMTSPAPTKSAAPPPSGPQKSAISSIMTMFKSSKKTEPSVSRGKPIKFLADFFLRS